MSNVKDDDVICFWNWGIFA